MHTTQCSRHLESPRWSVLQKNSATILSMSFLCRKKVKKIFTNVCFCICLCVMFVPHECSLYLYVVCDCASIFGQYSDIDLSNAGHSLLPWILMMFLCSPAANVASKQKHLGEKTELGDYKTSTKDASSMHLQKNKKGSVASVVHYHGKGRVSLVLHKISHCGRT